MERCDRMGVWNARIGGSKGSTTTERRNEQRTSPYSIKVPNPWIHHEPRAGLWPFALHLRAGYAARALYGKRNDEKALTYYQPGPLGTGATRASLHRLREREPRRRGLVLGFHQRQ